ncbi:class I adenylate-forming enzyme family protein [Oricola indica]|uniref:class I adenylate-forming enzyme family protein n=1 Tax=Oricola indica TaxID=2872591 RepID=UPI003CCBFD7F
MSSETASVLSMLPVSARISDVRTGSEMSASDIGRAARKGAVELSALGLDHGARIVVSESDGIDFLIALFACWEAGFVAVGVNSALTGAEQENVIEATGARHWIGERRCDMPRPDPDSSSAVLPLGLDEPALILMTSGTTGRPKGIVHSRRSLLARISLNIVEIGCDALSQVLCVLPVFFGHGLIGNCLTPLFAGGHVHIWTVPDMSEMRGLSSVIEARRIGFMSSVPSFWKIALRVSDSPSIPMTRIHVGSAPLSIGQWRDIAKWGGTDNVFNMFGMTETANWIGGGSLRDDRACDGYVGPIWGGALAVRDANGRISGQGRGEVLVQTPSIMLGYWQRPDLQTEAFCDGWFRTGDTGEIDDEGHLVLAGRIKSEINRGGIKVQAEEVDMMLERHADIAEACAFGIPDPVAGEAVAAAVVLKPGSDFDAEAIKAWCRTQARADAVPSRLYRLDAIPRNDRGKIVRADVRNLVAGET